MPFNERIRYVPDNSFYSLMAVLHEINRKELDNKLVLFPENLRCYVPAASGIVGSENARRIKETPAGVAKSSEEFVSKLLEVTSFEDTESFRTVLSTYLIATLKDELKFCCLNCLRFDKCLGIDDLSVGGLFRRRVQGEETRELRRDISREVEKALRNTPYIASDEAYRLCKDFNHQYNASNIGEVFGRYADIAVALQVQYGLDYKKFLQEIVSVNMTFFEKCHEKTMPR
jgi:hypothetical protein